MVNTGPKVTSGRFLLICLLATKVIDFFCHALWMWKGINIAGTPTHTIVLVEHHLLVGNAWYSITSRCVTMELMFL